MKNQCFTNIEVQKSVHLMAKHPPNGGGENQKERNPSNENEADVDTLIHQRAFFKH